MLGVCMCVVIMRHILHTLRENIPQTHIDTRRYYIIIIYEIAINKGRKTYYNH